MSFCPNVGLTCFEYDDWNIDFFCFLTCSSWIEKITIQINIYSENIKFFLKSKLAGWNYFTFFPSQIRRPCNQWTKIKFWHDFWIFNENIYWQGNFSCSEDQFSNEISETSLTSPTEVASTTEKVLNASSFQNPQSEGGKKFGVFLPMWVYRNLNLCLLFLIGDLDSDDEIMKEIFERERLKKNRKVEGLQLNIKTNILYRFFSHNFCLALLKWAVQGKHILF